MRQLLVLITLVIFAGCNKKPVPFVPLNPYLADAVPYKDGQQLLFHNGADTYTTTVTKFASKVIYRNCDDCPPTYSGDSIAYEIRWPDGALLARISFGSYDNEHLFFDVSALPDFWNVGNYPKTIGRTKLKFGPATFFYNSISMGGRTFDNVTMLYIPNYNVPCEIKDIYYSKALGIVALIPVTCLRFSLK